jgi:two-component system C4-dicarboxylate transport response regulator DctD
MRTICEEVIFVDDDEDLRAAHVQGLELAGFKVRPFGSAVAALAAVSQDFQGAVVTDVRMPGMDGLELFRRVQALDPDIPVLLITGHGDVGMAVEAMRAGAYDFVEKPFSSDRLLEIALRAQEKRSLVLENRRLREAWAHDPELPPLVGQSPAIERVRALIRSLGPADVDVLINGQTGTGKEVVARQLHAASGRKGPFVALNCAALPETVFESEIFGHEAGAFTGAQKRRIGKLEYAHGGTLFLDEIESMPMALQVKLLRVLQERRLERLGGNESVAIDCRVVAASKADLLKQAGEGLFREDLYYRIGVVAIDLPALSQRGEDIPLLLAHFCQAAAIRYRREIPPWTTAQMQQWQLREWPGNVRELRNFADRWVLGVEQIAAPAPIPGTEAAPLPQQVESFEAGLIAVALRDGEGSVAAAAERLGIPRKTLYDKIKKYGLGVG